MCGSAFLFADLIVLRMRRINNRAVEGFTLKLEDSPGLIVSDADETLCTFPTEQTCCSGTVSHADRYPAEQQSRKSLPVESGRAGERDDPSQRISGLASECW
jgi:hypothetical protein